MSQNDFMTENHINWFPGHMQKTRRLIQENLKLVDVVVELLDARLPESSANPMLREIIGGKPCVVALNKADLADASVTKRWIESFAAQGIAAVPIDALTGKGIRRLVQKTEELARPKTSKFVAKNGKPRAARAMIVGIPNVGKSSLINRLAGKAKVRVENRPGVTRDKQWVRVGSNVELLDMPGILWPKFEDPAVGMKLAFVGSVSQDAYDAESLSVAFLCWMQAHYPSRLAERYKLTAEEVGKSAEEVLQAIGKKRGCLIKGGGIDYDKVWRLLLVEFRAGKLGMVSLDTPNDGAESNGAADDDALDAAQPGEAAER